MQTILIVDDDRATAKCLSWILESYNFNVLTADDGLSAREVIEQEQPDLILSDLNMPAMNGLSLFVCVKANPEKKHIPFMLMSAEHTVPDVPFDAVIRKPVEVKSLLDHVKRLLPPTATAA